MTSYPELVILERRTKIVATLGPASDSPEKLRALIGAGMDAARLNLSHGAHEDHAERARRVRDAEVEAGRPIALIADLQGPKLRIGDLAEPVVLRNGENITVSAEDGCKDGDLPVAPAVIGDVLKPGHDVLIDDGLVRLRVGEVEQGRACCEVIVGGTSHRTRASTCPAFRCRSRRSRARTPQTSSSRSSSASTSSRSRSCARLRTCATCAR